MKLEKEYRAFVEGDNPERLVKKPLIDFINGAVPQKDIVDSGRPLQAWLDSLFVDFSLGYTLVPETLAEIQNRTERDQSGNIGPGYQGFNLYYTLIPSVPVPVSWLDSGRPGLKTTPKRAKVIYYINEERLLNELENSGIIKNRRTRPGKQTLQDWTTVKEPIDLGNKYSVPVDTDGTESEDQIKEKSAKKLLSSLGKSEDPAYVEAVKSQCTITETQPGRCKEKHNVEVPKSGLFQLPDAKLEDLEIPFGSMSSGAIGLKVFVSNVGKASDFLRLLGRQFSVGTTNISIPNFSFDKEANRLDGVLDHLQRLISFNIRRPALDDTISFDFDDSSGELNFININDVPQVAGFDAWKNLGSLQYPRTVWLAANINDFLTDAVKLTPDKLLAEYIQFPGINFDFSSLGSFEQQLLNYKESLIKTDASRDLEDQFILSSDIQARLSELNANARDFVDNSILRRASELISKLNSVDDVYRELLNKIDLQVLMLKSIELTSKRLPNAQFNEALRYSSLASLDFSQLRDLVDRLSDTRLRNGIWDSYRGLRDLDFSLDINSDTKEEILDSKGRLLTGLDITSFDILMFSIEDIGGLGSIFAMAENLNLIPSLSDQFSPSFDIESFGRSINSFIPSISILDNLPTSNPMGNVSEIVSRAINGVIESTLIAMARDILSNILNASLDIGTRDYAMEDVLDDGLLVDKLSLDMGTYGPFLNKMFSLMAPQEMIDFLDDRPSESTSEFASCLIDQEFPEIKEDLDTGSKIDDFILSISTTIPIQKKAEIRDVIEFQTTSASNTLCDPEDDIDEREQKAIARDKSLVKSLMREVGSNENPLAGAFGNRCKDGQAGTQSQPVAVAEVPMPASVLSLQETAIDTTFGAARSSFHEDVFEFFNSLYEQTEKKLTIEEMQKAEEIRFQNLAKAKLTDEQRNLLIGADINSLESNIQVAPYVKEMFLEQENFMTKISFTAEQVRQQAREGVEEAFAEPAIAEDFQANEVADEFDADGFNPNARRG